MIRKKIALIGYLLLLVSCSKGDTNSERDIETQAYFNRYTAAMQSNDTKFINETIAYIDKVIQSGSPYISSAYYNKAQLLYRLKCYDDAVVTIVSAKNNDKDFYLATLYLRLGQKEKAIPILDALFEKNRQTLLEDKNDKKAKIHIGESTIIMLNLLQEATSGFLDEMIHHGVFTTEEVESMKSNSSLQDTATILLSLWPE